MLTTAKKLWIFTFVLAIIGSILLAYSVNDFNESNGGSYMYAKEAALLLYFSIVSGATIWIYSASAGAQDIGKYVAIGLVLTMIIPRTIVYFIKPVKVVQTPAPSETR